MSKQPVDLLWFDELRSDRLDLEWIMQLRGSVEKIVSFGCWSSEPFALLWFLDATEIKTVEKEEENFKAAKTDKERLENVKSALEGRFVDFIVADMSERIDMLDSNYFDLAYCERVLYQIEAVEKLQNAVSQMARVIKPSGWVIAVEPGDDIAPLFEEAGLYKDHLNNVPRNAYCYRKPQLKC